MIYEYPWQLCSEFLDLQLKGVILGLYHVVMLKWAKVHFSTILAKT
jgi:hypothetical protein